MADVGKLMEMLEKVFFRENNLPKAESNQKAEEVESVGKEVTKFKNLIKTMSLRWQGLHQPPVWTKALPPVTRGSADAATAPVAPSDESACWLRPERHPGTEGPAGHAWIPGFPYQL